MGRLSGESKYQISIFKLISEVQMGIGSCTRSSSSRSLPDNYVCGMGNLGCKIPNVSPSPRAKSSNPYYDFDHHLHFRSKFFLRDFILAHSSVQRIWP